MAKRNAIIDPIHRIITGQTMTGKTTYARALCEKAVSAGWIVLAYDPIGGAYPGAVSFDEDQIDEFIDVCEQLAERADKLKKRGHLPPPILAIIDEADIVFNHSDYRSRKKLLTRYRHYNFNIVLVTQRPNMVHPTIRGQCGEGVCFLLSKTDAKMLADDLAAPGLIGAMDIPAGTYLRAFWENKQRVVRKGKMF